ncbi:hypothetical protein GCM10010988_17470 [Cnuibacter physcomitrellae]|nr:hypothetical protein GCM10010988_17470 [Cnuibacter physcomitrellae]
MTQTRASQTFRSLVRTILAVAAGDATVGYRDGSPGQLAPGTQITGLPGDWSVVTSTSAASSRISLALDSARAAANADGRTRYAAVLPRAGATYGGSYVVTDLDTFSDLIREAANDE